MYCDWESCAVEHKPDTLLDAVACLMVSTNA